MNRPVIAIGLDAADPSLIEQWMEQGYLKNLSRLREQGAYGRLKTFDYYRAETPWTTFLTGCSPQRTGYWSPLKFYPDSYEAKRVKAYNYAEYPPFYALGNQRKVAVFDMPQAPLSDQVDGLQVLAWGAHSPQTPSHSIPADLLQELIDLHGEHPLLEKDGANTFDLDALKRLYQGLEVGISRRATICQDLLQREPWDLFLTIFGEAHVLGHYFWHLSQTDHPLYPSLGAHYPGDPLREGFEAIDRAIGEIVAKAPEEAQIVIFSAHGMGANVMDIPSLVFLSEFLYRFNFPDKLGIAPGKIGTAPGSVMVDEAILKQGWAQTVWNLKHESNPIRGLVKRLLPNKYFKRLEFLFGSPEPSDLISPFQLKAQGVDQPFQPAIWYKHLWPQMKAFALPSFSEGYIRINLQGRESQGIVEPAEYEALCDELTQKLYRLKDARTGIPMVKNVIRTRQQPLESDPKLPDADLVVIWQEDCVTDVVDSPDIGRIGPVPLLRTGSHRADGFFLAQGAGIQPGSNLAPGHSLDLAPTILNLMGVTIPEYFEGKPLVKMPVSAS